MEGIAAVKKQPTTSKSFALASPAVRMAPSLLSADFAHLDRAVTAVEAAGATVLHLDVMDGHFVPNISFGVPVIASLRADSKMFFDAHLMIAEPRRYAEAFVQAGCDHVTFHIEATETPESLVDHIRGLGASVGVALNPTTPASAIAGVVERVDMVLVMSVWPGFGGQKFIGNVLEKVKEFRGRLAPNQRLEIDGGIDKTSIVPAAAAGVDTFVAGSAIFGQSDPAAAMSELHRLALENS